MAFAMNPGTSRLSDSSSSLPDKGQKGRVIKGPAQLILSILESQYRNPDAVAVHQFVRFTDINAFKDKVMSCKMGSYQCMRCFA